MPSPLFAAPDFSTTPSPKTSPNFGAVTSRLAPAQNAVPLSGALGLSIRRMENEVAGLLDAAAETITRSGIYFSRSNLLVLGEFIPPLAEADALAIYARGLLAQPGDMTPLHEARLRRVVQCTFWAEAAVRAASRAAHVSLLLQNFDAPPVALREAAFPIETALRQAAKSVASDDIKQAYPAFHAAGVAAQQTTELETLLYAMAPLLEKSVYRLTRAALLSLGVTADCAALVAEAWTTPLREATLGQ